MGLTSFLQHDWIKNQEKALLDRYDISIDDYNPRNVSSLDALRHFFFGSMYKFRISLHAFLENIILAKENCVKSNTLYSSFDISIEYRTELLTSNFLLKTNEN